MTAIFLLVTAFAVSTVFSKPADSSDNALQQEQSADQPTSGQFGGGQGDQAMEQEGSQGAFDESEPGNQGRPPRPPSSGFGHGPPEFGQGGFGQGFQVGIGQRPPGGMHPPGPPPGGFPPGPPPGGFPGDDGQGGDPPGDENDYTDDNVDDEEDEDDDDDEDDIEEGDDEVDENEDDASDDAGEGSNSWEPEEKH